MFFLIFETKNQQMKVLRNIIALFSITFFLSPFYLLSQTWSEPINISNMEGVDSQPDITVDKDGVIHCVWKHIVETNYKKIFYSKSEDDGLTWTEPYDVSQNNEKWMGMPKIVADTNNKLYLTYQHNIGNYYNTVNVLQTFENGVWSEYDTITGGQLGVVDNFLAIDNNNRLYAFWYWGQTTFYRSFENGEWSEIYNANVGSEGKPFIMDVVADKNNDMHCLFMFWYNWQTSDSAKVTYSKLTPDNTWSELEVLSSPTRNANRTIGIDVDTANFPHIAYREVTPWEPAPKHDTTIYRYKNGNTWSSPEVLVTDPFAQDILIDENNKPNVFDVEKLEGDSCMLVHHYKEYSWWESIVVTESAYASIQYSTVDFNNSLFCSFLKPLPDNYHNSEIHFVKSNLLTKTENQSRKEIFNVHIYPNPFKKHVNILFKINETKTITVKIYNYNGELIKTLMNSKISHEQHQLIWDGTDNNGNIVSSGQYLLRIRAGQRITSRPITFTN